MGGALAFAVGYAAATPEAPSGGPITVAPSPASSEGETTSAPRICPSVTAFVTGGSGSYTYSWAVTLAAAGTLTIISPTSRTTGFRFDAADTLGAADVRVTVTDTVTAETAFADVSVSYTEV